MERYSKSVNDFLIKVICPILHYDDYNEDNIGEIVDYIIDNIEGPFSQAEEAGDILSIEEQVLFKAGVDAVTEITTREDW